MLATWRSKQRTAILGCVVVALAACGCGSSTASPEPTSSASEPTQEAIVTNDPLHPIVEVRTNKGVLKFALDAEKAPETVRNFIHYVDAGHYDGTIFHQVEKGYAMLGGGYTPDLRERAGRYGIRNEATNGLKNLRGSIAMARFMDVVDSATCQFIINLADNPTLDHQGSAPEEFGFAVFGRLVSGQETLDRIASVQVTDTEQFPKLPLQAVVIETVRRLR